MVSTLPLATDTADLSCARAAAPGLYSSPVASASGHVAFRRAKKPPVPQPASSILPRGRPSASSTRVCRARYHHMPSSTASMSWYSCGSTQLLLAWVARRKQCRLRKSLRGAQSQQEPLSQLLAIKQARFGAASPSLGACGALGKPL